MCVSVPTRRKVVESLSGTNPPPLVIIADLLHSRLMGSLSASALGIRYTARKVMLWLLLKRRRPTQVDLWEKYVCTNAIYDF
jgi:hypothetical protein